ncbi:cytochrome P450, partial [Microbispora sp. NEAU-D428]|uniref:cytochrome P450 n=1 Tax=Microbispora sitophila TaxID=2771537 RepID=UPI00186822AB
AGREFKEAGLALTVFGRNVALADPPDHMRLRKLAMKAFTPRNVETWRVTVHDAVHRLLDKAVPRGEMDVVKDFASVIPAEAIGGILGVRADQRLDVLRHVEAVVSAIPERIRDSSQWLMNHARELVAFKRAHPADDLTSRLIETRDGGDRLDETELVAMVQLLIFTGYDTTRHLISNAALALLDHPDQLAILRQDLSLMPQAVEEFLRYEGSLAASVTRFAKQDLELAGVELPAGAAVWGMLMSANRDPERFPDPDRLDLARQDVRHLGLGHGLHNCMGAALARMQAHVAIAALVSRLPGLALTVPRDGLRYQPSMVSRSLQSLPV